MPANLWGQGDTEEGGGGEGEGEREIPVLPHTASVEIQYKLHS